jgi:acyl carrier protein
MPNAERSSQMLPESVLSFLDRAAAEARVEMPGREASLFLAGVLDSFSLVDFVVVLERECGVAVPDAELRPETFESLARIEAFVDRARAA